MALDLSVCTAHTTFIECVRGTPWIHFNGFQTPGTAIWDEEDRRYAYIVKPNGMQERFYEADYLEEQAGIAADEAGGFTPREREDFIESYVDSHTGA